MTDKDLFNNLKESMENHFESDNVRFTEIRDILESIRSNHLAHIQSDLDIMKTDMAWIKKFFWLIAGISVSSVGGAIFAAILK